MEYPGVLERGDEKAAFPFRPGILYVMVREEICYVIHTYEVTSAWTFTLSGLVYPRKTPYVSR